MLALYLRGIRCRNNIPPENRLAEMAGINYRHISELENVKKLAMALGCDYRAFL